MLKNGHPYAQRNVWSGFLFGIGLVAFIDETFFTNYYAGITFTINRQLKLV